MAQQKPLPNGLYAVFETSMGTFKAKLYEKDTPIAVGTFVGLATGTKAWLDPQTRKMVKRPLYDNITFHRVVDGTMIQAGDPTGTGRHNCGFTIRDEFLPGLRFDRAGKLAMANTGAPDSSGCQFFVTVGPMSQWDGKYTIFGYLVEGQDVVDRIDRVRTLDEKPVTPVKLLSVLIERVGPEPKPRKK
ncbi:MAG TPA: peptidylprolyl isomerase [Verrucomicrobiae bacterium]|nr:peptidylprolyl isomerase [Verrucomicrobiae bacterium]